MTPAAPAPPAVVPHACPRRWLKSTPLATIPVINAGPLLQDLFAHLSHSIERNGPQFWALWSLSLLWCLGYTAAFLIVAALSAIADWHFFSSLERGDLTLLVHEIPAGIRTFFKLVRDNQTPALARFLLLIALVPWLLPWELIPDAWPVPACLDELVITFAAAKAFMYLCPDQLIRKHSAALES